MKRKPQLEQWTDTDKLKSNNEQSTLIERLMGKIRKATRTMNCNRSQGMKPSTPQRLMARALNCLVSDEPKSPQ